MSPGRHFLMEEGERVSGGRGPGQLLQVGGVREPAGAWALRGGSLGLKSIPQESRAGEDKPEFLQELGGTAGAGGPGASGTT